MRVVPGDAVRPGAHDVYLVAHLFQRSRLTLARELRKLTKADLAERIGKTPSAVSQYESGRIRPDGPVVAELAMALQVPVGFFAIDSGGQVMSVEDCHFRSLRSASQRDRRCLLARGSLLCSLCDEIEQFVDLPADRIPREEDTVQARDDIERSAEAVRAAWGLGAGPISNMVWLLERHGAVVSLIPSDCSEVDAFSGWRASSGKPRAFVFLTTARGSTSRSRFDAAHELGHLVMHADAHPGNADIEQQANQFASSFLLPKVAFAREAPRLLDWNLIWELKRRWKVSARAILFRAHELGVLGDASYRRGFIYLNQHYPSGERDEPPHEQPIVLREALPLVAEDLGVAGLAERLGLNSHDLLDLVPGIDDPA